MESIGDGEPAPDVADHEVLRRIHVFTGEERHLDGGEDEDAAEDEEDPRELRDQLCADGDHQAAHRDGADDAPEQHPMLIFTRHCEILKQHRDDEHVVDAERFLDDVSGDELEEGRPAVVDAAVGKRRTAIDGIRRHPEPEPAMLVAQIDESRERQREHHPHARPGQRFANRNDVGLAVKDSEIEGEQEENEDKKGNPDDHHGLQALVVVSRGRSHRLDEAGSECFVLTASPPACAGCYSLPTISLANNGLRLHSAAV